MQGERQLPPGAHSFRELNALDFMAIEAQDHSIPEVTSLMTN